MPRTISFTLPGEPVAWQRRVVTKAGQQFTPAKARARMAEVRWAFDQAAPGWKPHEGPVALTIDAFLKPPKNWPKWRRATVDGRTWPAVGCCKKPDASNILKLIEDALNGVAFASDRDVFVFFLVESFLAKE